MIDYDAIEAAFLLQHDRSGALIGKEPIPLESLRFIVDAQGRQCEPPFPSYLIADEEGRPQIMCLKDAVELVWKEAVAT